MSFGSEKNNNSMPGCQCNDDHIYIGNMHESMHGMGEVVRGVGGK